MSMKQKPAFIIAATKSGGGKTTLTLGIMAALVNRGLKVQPFKCGPDFIDPTLHRTVTDNDSYNLDLKMMGGQCCQETFQSRAAGADVAVVEGVMGLFDGGTASTAALARCLGLPVFLIIDAQSSAESCAAVLKGFEEYDPEVGIAGVIFNKIGSPRHRELIEGALVDRRRTKVIGYVGRDDRFVIPNRHLGLHMGDEKPLDQSSMQSLAQAVEEQLDLDLMLNISRCSLPGVDQKPKNMVHPGSGKVVHIGVALDEAFCFYYPQNFELLREYGFEIEFFSPLHDRGVPDSLQMLYFGGGYPENFALQLSKNQEMRTNIRELFLRKIPIYGECGGFMYLCDSLADMDGRVFEMAGIFPFRATMNKRLRRLGYRRVTLNQDSLLGGRGDMLHGHEFHYSDIEQGSSCRTSDDPVKHLYLLDNNSYEGYSTGSAVGSYVHLHFGSTPSALKNLHAQLS